jgi:hypothetical protein
LGTKINITGKMKEQIFGKIIFLNKRIKSFYLIYPGTKVSIAGNKNLDTLEQKITDSRTNYNYRWNRSLPPKNHGTKIWILWNKRLLIAE